MKLLLLNKQRLFSVPIIILVFLFILGILLRGQESFSSNAIFLLDQGRDLLDVKKIVFDHKPTLIGPYTGLQGVFQGPLFYYSLAIPIFLTNGNPISPVWLMFILSLMVMGISFFGMKRFFGLPIALVTLFLFTISPEAIASATYSWNPHPMWLLMIIYVFIFFELTQKKYSRLLILLPIISIMFHFESALAAFIVAGTFLYFVIFERIVFLKKQLYIGAIIGLLFFLPLLLFDIRHDFLMTRSVLELLSGENKGLFAKGESTSYINLLIGHFYAFYGNFRSVFPIIEPFDVVPLGAVILAGSLLLIHKGKKIYSPKELDFIIFIGRLVIIVFFLSCLFPFPMRYWYLTGFQVLYLLFFGVLFGKLIIYKLGKILLFSLAIVALFLSFQKLYYLYIAPPNDGGVAKLKGKLAAIDYIYHDANKKPFNVLVFTPPVNTDAYDYLIWWRGKNVYNYMPGNEKKGIFYLLIEPDPSKPWSYQGWLETVIKTGTIVETKQLPSGLIVQKRYEEAS